LRHSHLSTFSATEWAPQYRVMVIFTDDEGWAIVAVSVLDNLTLYHAPGVLPRFLSPPVFTAVEVGDDDNENGPQPETDVHHALSSSATGQMTISTREARSFSQYHLRASVAHTWASSCHTSPRKASAVDFQRLSMSGREV